MHVPKMGVSNFSFLNAVALNPDIAIVVFHKLSETKICGNLQLFSRLSRFVVANRSIRVIINQDIFFNSSSSFIPIQILLVYGKLSSPGLFMNNPDD
jgi:hypothetical protein